MDQTTTNPYQQWLGLEDVQGSPNHYELFGLNPFESDTDAIKMAADRATARVRSFRPGSQAREWAALLDEIDQARKCLLDSDAKATYDEQLRSGGGSTEASETPEAASTPEQTNDSPGTFSGNPAMYPPGAGPAPMPEQPRYGPAGPPPDDATHTAASQPASTGDPSLFAPGFAPTPSASGNQEATTAEAATQDLNDPSPGVTKRPPPIGYDAAAAQPASPLGGDVDPMAPVSPRSYEPTQPQPGSLNPMAPVDYSANQNAVAQPASNVDPMAPMAMPVGGSGSVDPDPYATSQPTQPSPGTFGNAPIPLGPVAGTVESEGQPEAAFPAEENDASKRSSGNGRNFALAGAVAMVTLALGVAGLFVFWPNNDRDAVAQGPTDDGNVDPSDGEPADGEPGTPIGDGEQPSPEPEPIPEPEPQPPIEPTPPIEPEPPINVIPEPQPEPIPPEPPINVPPDVPNPGEVGPPITPDPQPPIVIPEPEPMIPLTPAEKDALAKALVAARTAMGARDQATAVEQLAIAKSIARTDEQKAMVKRLEELHHYVKEFWRSVDEAYVNLKPASAIPVGNSEAIIVEVREDAIVLRYFGRNRTIQRDEIPSGLALAIANTWFTDDAENKVVIGALHFVDPSGRKEETRRLWQEAQAAGVDVEPLLPVLDDNYQF